ncbi:hypothetical protein [Roseisolibacter sp. H3M3-2]|uniref:hypothetical protein n=1 Tax=Roseisolibacter sp. H3M3-2 TaxID=3031323 RepID=UPI0023DA4F2F|nr:hypothetical protein [Roseisolibacter sp. H3M3-2]MDF1505450.1 hypothetical protein [Roseisolibacter sp. H3M3-2]
MTRRPAPRLAALALALAAAGAPLAAQPPGGGRGGAGAMQAMLFEGITLSAAQQTRVDSVRAAFRARAEADRPAAPGERPDSATMAARRERMTAERSALRGLLTADQAATFDRNVEKMEERMREMRARRGAPPA